MIIGMPLRYAGDRFTMNSVDLTIPTPDNS